MKMKNNNNSHQRQRHHSNAGNEPSTKQYRATRRKHHRNTHVPSPSSSTAAIFKHTTPLSEQLNDHSTDRLSTTVQARLNTAQRFELLEKQIIVT
jgi:hypothetical protein